MYLRFKNYPKSFKSYARYDYNYSEAFKCYIDKSHSNPEFRYFNENLIKVLKYIGNNRNKALLNINHDYFLVKNVCEEILYYNNTVILTD